MDGKATYTQLGELLGENWQDRDGCWLNQEEYVSVHFGSAREGFDPYRHSYDRFIRAFDHLYCLSLSGYDKWGGLPDPWVVFQVDSEQESVSVIVQEDWFHHDGHEPRQRIRVARSETGEVDVELQNELNQYLLDWVEQLIELGFRPSARWPISA